MFFLGAKRSERREPGGWRGPLTSKTKNLLVRRVASGPGSAPRAFATGEDVVVRAGDESAPGPAEGTSVSEVKGLDLRARIGTASFAFRGYDVTNLGRSPELLAHRAYGPLVRRMLDEASAISSEALGRPFDLAARVEAQTPSTLDEFAADIATIVTMGLAQLELLEEFFGVAIGEAQQSFGYSIGELTSLVSGGMFTLEQLLPVPLACAQDCAELAAETTLGIIFSRGPALSLKDVQALCTSVSNEGRGMVGVSTYLSPNTVLVMGQGNTLDRLESTLPEFFPDKVLLRRKPQKLPPLHTPLVWQRCIPNRAAVAIYKIGGVLKLPSPPIVSCVTGKASYDPLNARDTLIQWVDHPQLLWDVLYETLVEGVNLVIHAGPAPNLVPSTFERISNNVTKQFGNRYIGMIGREFGSRMHRHAWLSRILPSRAALLRAPHVEHVVLEDWLLDQTVN
jgi:[acyl-carrier-protein] S-malonyltransferase